MRYLPLPMLGNHCLVASYEIEEVRQPNALHYERPLSQIYMKLIIESSQYSDLEEE